MEQAQQQFKQAGLNGRCTCVPGSFLERPARS